MYCHCCQTRILRDEINSNAGCCPECGTVPEWHSKLWDDEDEVPEEEALVANAKSAELEMELN